MFALTMAILITVVSSVAVDAASVTSPATITTTLAATSNTTVVYYYPGAAYGNSTQQPTAAKSGTTLTAIFLGVGIALLIVMVLVVYYILRTFVCTYVKKLCGRGATAHEEVEGGEEVADLDDMSDVDDVAIGDGGADHEQYSWGAQNHDDDEMVVVQIESPRHDDNDVGSVSTTGSVLLLQQLPSTPMAAVMLTPAVFEVGDGVADGGIGPHHPSSVMWQ